MEQKKLRILVEWFVLCDCGVKGVTTLFNIVELLFVLVIMLCFSDMLVEVAALLFAGFFFENTVIVW